MMLFRKWGKALIGKKVECWFGGEKEVGVCTNAWSAFRNWPRWIKEDKLGGHNGFPFIIYELDGGLRSFFAREIKEK
jgi:hypothetical protein